MLSNLSTTSLTTLFFIASTVLFLSLSLVLAIKERHNRKLNLEREALLQRRLYENTIMRAIQEKIGYSLDLQKVTDTIIGSLKNIFPYATASSLIIQEEKLLFKANIEEHVNSKFIDEVKRNMLTSLSSMTEATIPLHVDESRTGIIPDEASTATLGSYFNIPLMINSKAVGLINVSSTKKAAYKETEMTMLYQLANQASSALSRLKEVITNEEEKLLAMIKSLEDGIFMVDTMQNLTIINSSAKRFLHIDHIQSPSFFDVITQLSKTYDFAAKIKEAMEENKTIKEKEVVLEEYTVQVIITPVVGTVSALDSSPLKNHVIGVTVLLHDITLEKSLARMKEDFTNSMVHELRSPLTAIKAAAELMVKDENLNEDQKRLINIIDSQSKRMLTDITSLLDVATLESGHFTLFQSPTDMKKMIDETVSMFLPEAKKKNIELNSDLEENLPKGFVDPVRTAQSLNNLLSNSMKFTNSDGKIDIHARLLSHDHLGQNANPGIMIAVSDNGIGIPPEKQKTLFSKFSQANTGPMTPGNEGTGLGLFFCKGIVEAQGGTILLDSEPGKGTTITFTIPLAGQSAAVSTQIPSSPEKSDIFKQAAINTASKSVN